LGGHYGAERRDDVAAVNSAALIVSAGFDSGTRV